MSPLVWAIIHQENGERPYPTALIAKALFLAASSSTCTSTANAVAAAQTALTLAETTLAAVQAGQQKSNKTLIERQADVTAAQAVFNTVSTTYTSKCGVTTVTAAAATEPVN